MSEIDRFNGTTKGSNGGTELSYRALVSLLPPETLDKYQIICSRVRDIDPNKKQILWLHDYYQDPENDHLLDPENHKKFEKFVFVSQHQFHSYHQRFGIKYNQSVVIRNAIEPIQFKPKSDGPLKLIYHTTPHRGLNILAPVFDHLSKSYDIELDVFSSFDIYGWTQKNPLYEELFEYLKSIPKVRYHGFQPNSVVREALQEAHIFAYPCIWPETSCIAAIEATAAGCLTVSSDLAALPETLSGVGIHYRYDEDINKHAETFAQRLELVIQHYQNNREYVKEVVEQQSTEFNYLYSWKQRILEWNRILL